MTLKIYDDVTDRVIIPFLVFPSPAVPQLYYSSVVDNRASVGIKTPSRLLIYDLNSGFLGGPPFLVDTSGAIPKLHHSTIYRICVRIQASTTLHISQCAIDEVIVPGLIRPSGAVPKLDYRTVSTDRICVGVETPTALHIYDGVI
jgi:hypothetical protein